MFNVFAFRHDIASTNKERAARLQSELRAIESELISKRQKLISTTILPDTLNGGYLIVIETLEMPALKPPRPPKS